MRAMPGPTTARRRATLARVAVSVLMIAPDPVKRGPD